MAKIFVWGTLTSRGGNAHAMTREWRSKFIRPATIQGVHGEVYEVPEGSVKEMDSFERKFGYIRVVADVDRITNEFTFMYVHTPAHDGYYTGSSVKEARKNEKFADLGSLWST